MNGKSKLPGAIAVFFSAMMSILLRPAVAMEISWYEQRAPGHAAGEVRITDLAEGEFEFETPGRDLEVGIARHGDIAVVILDDRGRPAKPGRLLLVARQDGRAVRATYPLVMSAQVKPAVQDQAAASGPAPETEPAVQTGQRPETAAKPLQQGITVLADSGTGVTRENGTVLAESSGTAILPAASNPSPDPSSGAANCRVIILRPGSLRQNIERLVRECGARLGRWYTSSSPEWLVDWKVPAAELLTRSNSHGLTGLLDILEARYRLAGVPDVDRPGVFDFYRLRMDSYPSGWADANNPNTPIGSNGYQGETE